MLVHALQLCPQPSQIHTPTQCTTPQHHRIPHKQDPTYWLGLVIGGALALPLINALRERGMKADRVTRRQDAVGRIWGLGGGEGGVAGGRTAFWRERRRTTKETGL